MLKQLDEAIKKAPKGDCVVVIGDLNEELSRNVSNHTGRFTRSEKGSRNSNKIINLMRSHDLGAVNTRFKKSKSPATYLQGNTAGDPTERFVGRNVCVNWKGKRHSREGDTPDTRRQMEDKIRRWI